ncbi:hypothetical protein GCM10011507_05310 [Edaphobacter acidisoli]|uniref:Lysozyme inhibitor LprI-like N-terminal domain-containing protein n=1 Tax=Edaphobacter acidisoli TaxID=2040573 RepID=A0A916W0Q4_9BACT|nr:lysozyme inhibitor LprI family protein [Edaphobacter acidisoli]GGA56925.1 hypothetical protein GCM10011507_05310 [Edaphobacter acidisoli]
MAAIFLFLGLSATSFSQKCDYGSEKAFQATRQLLLNATSCRAASRILDECAWGSSADQEFSIIAVKKCEADFLPKLTPVMKKRYVEKMMLCDQRYADGSGTISISEAAICRMGVAYNFSRNPQKAATPPPRASFPCAKAATPLEYAICSDSELGHFDVFLSENYKAVLKSSSAKQQSILIADEKKWLKELPEKCGALTGHGQSSETLNCLREEFKRRVDLLDSCSMGGPDECEAEISRP